MPKLFFDLGLGTAEIEISDGLADHLQTYCRSADFKPEFRRRSHLFVPLLRQDFRDKIGRGEVPADTFIWDLEDSIPAKSKDEARACVTKLPPKPGHCEYAVRINAGDPREVDRDVDAIARYPFNSVTLPKGESGAQVRGLIDRIGHDKSYAVTIETARGLTALDEIAAALRPGRDALGFGVGDMSTELGVERLSTCENPFFQQILGMIAVTGRRYGLELLDSVSARFNDPENARSEARLSYRCYGYTGKKLINPKQLEAINSTFAPTSAEIAGHLDVMEAFVGSSVTNARVVSNEYKGLPAFIASERAVRRYLRQHYLSLTAVERSSTTRGIPLAAE